jgi:hypothetical protein
MKDAIRVLRRLVEEMNLILRGDRGYGAGQPWSPREPYQNLGKSSVDEFVEEYDDDDDQGGDDNKRKFKVSKIFKEREDEQHDP